MLERDFSRVDTYGKRERERERGGLYFGNAELEALGGLSVMSCSKKSDNDTLKEKCNFYIIRYTKYAQELAVYA